MTVSVISRLIMSKANPSKQGGNITNQQGRSTSKLIFTRDSRNRASGSGPFPAKLKYL